MRCCGISGVETRKEGLARETGGESERGWREKRGKDGKGFGRGDGKICEKICEDRRETVIYRVRGLRQNVEGAVKQPEARRRKRSFA